MKIWDLSPGAAKLGLAIQLLQKASIEAMEHWDDETHRDFEDNHLKPLEPKVRRTLDMIHRLEQVLAKAERECGSY